MILYFKDVFKLLFDVNKFKRLVCFVYFCKIGMLWIKFEIVFNLRV